MSSSTPRPVRHLAASLFICALLAGCGEPDAAQGEGAGGPPPAVVTTTVVQMQTFADRIDALGTVQARESVDVTAKVSETVARVHFDSGDEVREGAVLVTLTGQQQQASLAAAQAEANEADQLFTRQGQLAEQQLIARASLDTQRAVRDSARARVAEIRANLGDRSIRAPFSGVLGIRQVSPGALVQPGTVVATLDDIARVYVDFPVPEAQLANVAAGQRLGGRSTAYPGRIFDGEVSVVDARIDAATRAVTVRGEFDNAERRLRPGMLIQVNLQREPREALLVPEIAVVQEGQETFVYRVGPDDTVSRAPIVVGTRADGRAEVVEGLSPGDRIVVDGTGKLRPGLRIVEGDAEAGGAQEALPGVPTGNDAPTPAAPAASAAPASGAPGTTPPGADPTPTPSPATAPASTTPTTD